MKNKYVFTAVLLSAILLCAYGFTALYGTQKLPDTNTEQLTVVTSFYPMYIAAANLTKGCEGIELQNLSEPKTGCLHDFQLTPEDMKRLSAADVFVANGGGMESFLEDVIAQYPDLQIIETISAGEESRTDGEGEAEEAQGQHIHRNAHAWMSVSHYRQQVKVIAAGFKDALKSRQLKREGGSDLKADVLQTDALLAALEKNAENYDEKLSDLQEMQQALQAQTKGVKVISFHEAYEFLAEEYGMEICYTLNLDEERQISAGEVADVLSEIEQNGVTVILAEEIYGRQLAETIQKETDVKICYLDTLTRGEYDLDSYINGMQANIQILQEAFGVN